MFEATDIFNPFPGLRPFETEEYNLFFGREGQSDELLARLGRTRFLAVVGTSGSGKSSLVRAGLLPALYGGLMAGAGSGWRVAVMRPGHDPLGNLARALAAEDVLGGEAAGEGGHGAEVQAALVAQRACQLSERVVAGPEERDAPGRVAPGHQPAVERRQEARADE